MPIEGGNVSRHVYRTGYAISDGGIDVSALEQVDRRPKSRQVSAGIVAIGTTGESPTLSHEEREQRYPYSSRQGEQTLPVLAGTGSNSTQHAIADTKLAEKPGSGRSAARWALITISRARKDFSAISKQSRTPRRCRSCSITSRAVAAWISCQRPWLVLAKECRNIVSIKEASGSVERVGELRRQLPDRLRF